MPSEGTVREWDDDQGMGVIDSADTPGGCWVHFSHIVTDGLGTLTPGEHVTFTSEARPQDTFGYRAILVWPTGVKPGTPQRAPDQPGTSGYQSTLIIEWADQPGARQAGE